VKKLLKRQKKQSGPISIVQILRMANRGEKEYQNGTAKKYKSLKDIL